VLFAGGILFGFCFDQVWQESGSDKFVVDEFGSVEPPGQETPDEEHTLEHPVERDEGEDEIGEELDDAQSSENHPIRQPDCVIVFALALDGQDGPVGGVGEPDSVADQLCPEANDDHSTEEESGPEHQFSPLDAGRLFYILKAFVELILLVQFLVQHKQGAVYGDHDGSWFKRM
jgi:hypothetical protein